MDNILNIAIEAVNNSRIAYCKFITANDVGTTKAHQYGYHIHKSSWSLFFDKPGVKGENKDRFINIKWQNDFITKSRFIYYGQKSRNEYRLTNFGRGFPYLKDDNLGDLLIICHAEKDDYQAFVLSTEDDIENFFATIGLSIAEANGIIPRKRHLILEKNLDEYYREFIAKLKIAFPRSKDLSDTARHIYNIYKKVSEKSIIEDSDKILLGWLDIEYELFKSIEVDRYSTTIANGFKDVDALINFSNSILNRRKSRAGKSLENHLASIFQIHKLKFETQVITEGRKKPDFIFPGRKEYHNAKFSFEDLVFLGAKTTCKDRWRQVLNEAKRIPSKHLFTLQQGISSNQLAEMKDEDLTLVVPSNYHQFYPKELRKDIWSLNKFVSFVKEKQWSK